ncbi:3-methyl-2-oxobutanoate hydroxymethyltransferase [Babesia caballi]|uniref:3-methyl-2-oxobutanoate hydroxymethyltransferase n=1 Tax=Babesia caballi TaxID=5871 RepID=A0AAV4LTJ9_BABCB|nr:3-methyl-2-oxobutanoate hydroxymethyltransferase [Babesia caballi]
MHRLAPYHLDGAEQSPYSVFGAAPSRRRHRRRCQHRLHPPLGQRQKLPQLILAALLDQLVRLVQHEECDIFEHVDLEVEVVQVELVEQLQRRPDHHVGHFLRLDLVHHADAHPGSPAP